MRRITALLMIAIALMLSSCVTTETGIRNEIDLARHCASDDDCVDVGGKCPFGCHIYVNREEAPRIKSLVESYPSDCIYDCMVCRSARCEMGKCEPICE